MAIETQILSSLSPNVVVGDPVGPSGRNQWKNLRSFDYFLCKTNPILSAVGGLQMNVSIFSTMNYENISDWTLGQNKPNSNPIKANFRKAQMNVNSLITKGYRKKDDFAVQKNKPNFRKAQNERKCLYHKGLQKKRCFSSPKKQTQSNPISVKNSQNKLLLWFGVGNDIIYSVITSDLAGLKEDIFEK